MGCSSHPWTDGLAKADRWNCREMDRHQTELYEPLSIPEERYNPSKDHGIYNDWTLNWHPSFGLMSNHCWSVDNCYLGWRGIDIYKFWFCFDNAESSRIHLLRHCLLTPAGFWFNIKMSSYQYRKSNCGDKTILRPSYLHNGISYTGKMTSLYWFSPLTLISYYNSFMIWSKMYHCLLTYLKHYFLNFVKIFHVFTYNINTVKKCSQYFYRVNGLVDPIMARIHTLIKQSRVSLSVKIHFRSPLGHHL